MTISCKTCRFALWNRTPTGRIRKGEAGICTYEIGPCPKLPVSVSTFSTPYWPPSKGGIWPDFGEECECYEISDTTGVNDGKNGLG